MGRERGDWKNEDRECRFDEPRRYGAGRAGGRFLDAGIIGPPPRGKAKTNLYVSGPGAADLEQLGYSSLRPIVITGRSASFRS